MALGKDLTGQRFGRLVVLRPTEERKNSSVVWECKCDCGNIVNVPRKSLVDGTTKSCGCLRREKDKTHFQDLTGQRFGKLVALRPMEQRKNGKVMWECQCDCGNASLVASGSLTGGATQSCGCLQREKARSRGKDISGQRFGKLVALRPTEERKNGSVVWECQCDCGNITYVPKNKLRQGRTKSCGCIRTNKDITGQRFGKLIALRPTEDRKDNKVVWECQCDCGNIAFVRVDSLLNGNTQSCGCLKKDNSRGPITDLTGQRFGKLIAIRPKEERKDGFVMWECQCDCGDVTYVRSASLTSGVTRSCGCLRRSLLCGKRFKDLSAQRFGKLIALRPTEKRKYGNVVWECQCDCGNIAFMRSTDLVNGNAQSCGCLRKSKEGGNKFKDLTGQRFGKLVALRPTEERKYGDVVWECQCDCGKTAFVISGNLSNGHTMSCGCNKREKRK